MKTLHPINAFGILKVSLSSIRIEKIEERVVPKVPFPHRHDFFQIMLVTEGSGHHQIDFKKHKVSKNQIYIMKPGQVHSWTLSSNIKGYIVEFNRGERLLDLWNFPDMIVLKKAEDFQKLIEVMFEEFQKGEPLFDIALEGYLSGFLVKLKRLAPEIGPLKSLELIDRFNQLVEEHFRKEHRVEFYAKNLKVTPKALTMQVTRISQKSPRQIIQERVLLEAKRLLAFSHLSVAQVGYEIGFDDANYFSRFFRLHEKITPAVFRKLSGP